jgi:hypothetical protein
MADKLSGSAIKPGTIVADQLSGSLSNSIDAAANTVSVSVNSESTLSNKQLNFINTDSITANITENGGNANVSFVFSGSGTPDYVLQSYGLI